MELPHLIQDLELLVAAEAERHERHDDGELLVVSLDPEGEPDSSLEDESDEHDPAAFLEVGRCSNLPDAVRMVVLHPRCPIDDIDPVDAGPNGRQFFRAMVDAYPLLGQLRTARYRNFALLQLLQPIERDELPVDPYLWCVEKVFRGYRLEVGWTAAPPLHDVAFAILKKGKAATKQHRRA